jgi:putative membrane protein
MNSMVLFYFVLLGQTQTRLPDVDRKFMEEAANAGRKEEYLGNIGQKNSQGDAVKGFALRMTKDHAEANAELEQLARDVGVPLPPSDGTSEAKDRKDAARTDASLKNAQHRSNNTSLETLTGHDFDVQFQKQMVADHEASVRLFERCSRHCQDARVKAFASRHLPNLQQHLSAARGLLTSTRDRK